MTNEQLARECAKTVFRLMEHEAGPLDEESVSAVIADAMRKVVEQAQRVEHGFREDMIPTFEGGDIKTPPRVPFTVQDCFLAKPGTEWAIYKRAGPDGVENWSWLLGPFATEKSALEACSVFTRLEQARRQDEQIAELETEAGEDKTVLIHKLALAKEKLRDMESNASEKEFEVRGDIEEIEAERDRFKDAYEERCEDARHFVSENADLSKGLLEATDQLKELESERDEWKHHCTELLARVHRDGGQYLHEHGLVKARDDADSIIARLLNDGSQAEVERLREALDKYGGHQSCCPRMRTAQAACTCGWSAILVGQRPEPKG